MTDRLYYTDSYLRGFTARITGHADHGRTVYLDRTAFYPTSGGQPFDTGSIAGVAVLDVVDEDERTIAFMDIAPATRGHALVIPREHTPDLLSVDPEDLRAVAVASQRLATRAKERLAADGVNLVNSCGAVAWQTIFHFHVHVIPRYEDDPLRLPWVPSEGDREQIQAAAQELSDG